MVISPIQNLNQELYHSYLKLIKTLLHCSNGEKTEILKLNQHLIDAHLVNVVLDLIQTTQQSASILCVELATEGSARLMKLVRELIGIYAETPLQSVSTEFAMGNVYLETKQFCKAKQSYEQALEIFRKQGDRTGEANTLALIGDTLYHQDNFTAALKFYTPARTIMLETRAKHSEAILLQQMISSCYFTSQYAEAIKLSERRLVIARELCLRSMEAHTLYALATYYEAIGCMSEAGDCYWKCWEIAQEIGASKLEIQSLKGLGDFYLNENLIEEAMDIYAECLDMASQMGYLQVEANCLQSLSKAYLCLGDEETAREYNQQSLKTKQTLDISLVEQML
ncbi:MULTISPECIES: tetratricopeptide repeat protein [Nostocales]|uniref:Tetratricopeptide repeat protein n=3 Tax=Nostocales TaxID=1161 RepID=A0A0C1R651_9CYAN|nr:tetratricopeptide repeat protein [Tolypothrix bouteillei]KAF3887993.1 tetratricopeptide repeat protein [Tolypothrix bouteillei VB521301]